MLDVLLALVPLMVGSAVLPTWISLVVLLLRGPRGITKALSFVGAVTAVRLLQGLGGGHLFRGGGGIQHVGGWPLLPGLLLVGGGILVGIGIHGLMSGARLANRPPAWFGPLRRAGPLKCAAAGLILILASPRQWVLTLSAVGLIREAGLGGIEGLIAFLIFTAGAESLTLAPIVWALIHREHMHRGLEDSNLWLLRNGRRIAGAVSIVVGAYFIWQGMTGMSGR